MCAEERVCVMTDDSKHLKYEQLPDGSLSVEMPGDGSLASRDVPCR